MIDLLLYKLAVGCSTNFTRHFWGDYWPFDWPNEITTAFTCGNKISPPAALELVGLVSSQRRISKSDQSFITLLRC